MFFFCFFNKFINKKNILKYEMNVSSFISTLKLIFWVP